MGRGDEGRAGRGGVGDETLLQCCPVELMMLDGRRVAGGWGAGRESVGWRT